ncbi:MAG: flagellar biosynthesis protein FlhB [Ignavibacteriales bacterium]|nr:flagellar biosynthesis protein FlhB [Ignavibacteriales bacterium]
MAEIEGQEKTEQPTGKKLSDARDKGQVAKSTELNSLVVFGSGLILIFITKGFIGEKLGSFTKEIFSSLETVNINQTILQAYFLKWTLFLFIILTPILIGLIIVSLVSNISQVGFKFSVKAFTPKLNRFNPIAGIKRIFFTSHSLVELLKSLAKLIIIGLFAYLVISKLIQDTFELVNLSIEEIVSFMLDAAFSMVWKIMIFFTLIAAVDFIFQKMKFKKEMMMTKQEVKDELKQTEGDTLIKSRIRKNMIQATRRRMMNDVPKADVVITNPTHFAVALKYEMNKDNAPKVLAKGMDELAQRIKKIAVENEVPLYEDRELARALYKVCDVGDLIPAKLFKAVAQILAYIYQMKKIKKQKSII